MKKTALGAVCAAITITLCAVELTRDGQPAAKIYLKTAIRAEPLPALRELEKMPDAEQRRHLLAAALLDLNYHLEKMSGTKLAVETAGESSRISGNAIVIGELTGIKPEKITANGEAFRLQISGNRILINGESDVGTAYGIYELLRRLGCDWTMPGTIGEIIPIRKNIAIEDCDVSSAPDFAVRAPWYAGSVASKSYTVQSMAEFNQWKLRHKMQITRDWHPLVMVGGHVWQLFTGRIYKKEFEKNPEMLALVRQPDGSLKRQGPQLETTHPEVLKLFEDYIRDLFRKNKWPKDKAVCIGIGPADGGGYSRSPESILAGSERANAITGGPDITDLQVLLCNQLLERLETEFPNLHLGFYLYSTHADFPARYTPHPKIGIVIADITYSRLHGTLEPQSKTRAYYLDILKQWAKTPSPKFFRGYNFNLADNFLPYSKLKMWGEDLPYYHKMGVIGVYNEWSKAWAGLAPGNYLEAALLWDSSQDWRQVLARYCRSAFGDGAPWMNDYYLMLTERQSSAGQEAGSYHSFPLLYGTDFIDRAESLFAAATAAARNDGERERIAAAAIPVAMLKRYLAYLEARNSFQFTEAAKQFDGLKAALNRHFEANDNMISYASIRYLDRFHKDFVEKARKYSTGDYRMVMPLPERLKTAFDPYDRGDVMNLYRPEINDCDYLITSTYASTWDAQGLIGYRSGSVWYRLEFAAPAEQNIGLLVGGADSVVRVWCNGEYIGMARGFAQAFEFDLTGTLKPGGGNLLAIQILHPGNSEVGTGGLIYPSFLFTGPRLKERAPIQTKVLRLLPGGAVAED